MTPAEETTTVRDSLRARDVVAPAPGDRLAPWDFFEAHRTSPFPFFLDRAFASRARTDPAVAAMPSFAGSSPFAQLRVDADGRSRVWREGRWQDAGVDPVDAVATFVEEGRASVVDAPAWLGDATPARTVGFLAYELGAWADGPRAMRSPASGCREPLAVLSTYAVVDAWDPVEGRRARLRFEGGHAAVPPPPLLPAPDTGAWRPTPRERYRRAFARILEAIAAGDIYQANLSRRAVLALDGDAADAYARLRLVQAVPWGAFLDYGGFALLSNSPELFLSRRGEALGTRPIKGTRPRRADAREDLAEREALLADAKEAAEHLMIVDLERNDLGRVAVTGSVRVDGFATVESYATVHHLVSTVSATAREGTGLGDLLRATFPGGSITGAPKIRAMELLAGVEDAARGPYTGVLGCWNGAASMDLSIAIRTAVVASGLALYSTGGGLVADSDVDREWEETELKLEAFRLAAGARAEAVARETGPAAKQARPGDGQAGPLDGESAPSAREGARKR